MCFSKEKPQPWEVIKVWDINEKYIYAKQISFRKFSSNFFFFFFYNKFHWIQFKVSKGDLGTNPRKTRKFKWAMQNQIHSCHCSTMLTSNHDEPLSPMSTECGHHTGKKSQKVGLQIPALGSDCCSYHGLEKRHTAMCATRTLGTSHRINSSFPIQHKCKRTVNSLVQNRMLWNPQRRADLGGLLYRWWVYMWLLCHPLLEIHPPRTWKFCSFLIPEDSWQSWGQTVEEDGVWEMEEF